MTDCKIKRQQLIDHIKYFYKIKCRTLDRIQDNRILINLYDDIEEIIISLNDKELYKRFFYCKGDKGLKRNTLLEDLIPYI